MCLVGINFLLTRVTETSYHFPLKTSLVLPHIFFFFSDASFEKESSQKAIASPAKFPGKSAAVNIEKRKKKTCGQEFLGLRITRKFISRNFV